jgi:thiamine transport system ATP-binding protein
MGESGAGKSSLLECIGGFLPADAGEIWLNNQRIDQLDASQRPVSSLFQQYNLFEHISVTENLRLGFCRAQPNTMQWQQVLQACEHLGVADLLQRLPGDLSGGQRQRVALIRTVLRDKPLLLLDEPFSALDAVTRQIAGDWIRTELNKANKIAILVTHQQSDSDGWADQTLMI